MGVNPRTDSLLPRDGRERRLRVGAGIRLGGPARLHAPVERSQDGRDAREVVWSEARSLGPGRDGRRLASRLLRLQQVPEPGRDLVAADLQHVCPAEADHELVHRPRPHALHALRGRLESLVDGVARAAPSCGQRAQRRPLARELEHSLRLGLPARLPHEPRNASCAARDAEKPARGERAAEGGAQRGVGRGGGVPRVALIHHQARERIECVVVDPPRRRTDATARARRRAGRGHGSSRLHLFLLQSARERCVVAACATTLLRLQPACKRLVAVGGRCLIVRAAQVNARLVTGAHTLCSRLVVARWRFVLGSVRRGRDVLRRLSSVGAAGGS
mmetsp:Transcript_8037/g.25795  ORF Transcript_8037/g.25795 Transcript_8037/m.25795 type:complete len:332 (+) Transcript_8037:39-1034(+)